RRSRPRTAARGVLDHAAWLPTARLPVMTVERPPVKETPATAETLPHKKTYGGSYVRIVDPGRHVFKSKLGFGRCFYSLAGLGFAAASVWLGAAAGRETSPDVIASIFQWMCAGGVVLGIVIAMLLALASQVVEITP